MAPNETTDADLDRARETGRTAAERQLKESPGRLLAMDELPDSPIDTAYAMGWNSVWASDLIARRRKEQLGS
jgi:hypothetical protein